MARIPLQSSVLAATEYLPEFEALDIVFNTGEVYRYLQVPWSLYEHLLQADSKGSFFNKYIRNQFSFQYLGNPETLTTQTN